MGRAGTGKTKGHEMTDRDVEDTRQPKEMPTHSACDKCGYTFDNDDLNQFGTLWLCDDCMEIAAEQVD
jgi:predicted Zn-ribbon and HTH transcriptional regulator